MISLLIGAGALFLAVIVSALIDPWPRPSPGEDGDETVLTVDATMLPI